MNITLVSSLKMFINKSVLWNSSNEYMIR